MDKASSKPRFPPHGYIGIAIMLGAEGLLFGGNQLVGHWFTPVVWTGYILFADALVFKLKGRSLVMGERLEFVIIVLVSIGGWWLCEFYNAPRFWKSDLELWWHYHNLEPNLFLRRLGYDWAFATISPAMFDTAELLHATVFSGTRSARAVKLSNRALYLMIGLGVVAVALPLVVISAWLVPLVWIGLILMLDPLNA